jgi:type IV secretory pathway TrbD component
MDSQVRTRPPRQPPVSSTRSRSTGPAHRARGRRGLLGGGTEGNERLTVLTGLLVIVVTAAVGVTIVKIGQLLWLHMFLGLLLIGPVALKLASTGYRFVRYYTANPRYHAKGPPAPALRIMAPLIVLLTVTVFASGVVLLFIGPGSSARSMVFLIHKASFIAWLALTAFHILGHLPEIVRVLRVSPASRRELVTAHAPSPGRPIVPEPGRPERLPGRSGRWLSLSGAMAIGLILALVLIPDFATWTGTAGQVLFHHHRHFH